MFREFKFTALSSRHVVDWVHENYPNPLLYVRIFPDLMEGQLRRILP
jgi:hypothetical protein